VSTALGARSEGIAVGEAITDGQSANAAVKQLEDRFTKTIESNSKTLETERAMIAQLQPRAQQDEVAAEILLQTHKQLKKAPAIAPVGSVVGEGGTLTTFVGAQEQTAKARADKSQQRVNKAVDTAAATQRKVSTAERQRAALRRALGTGGAVDDSSGVAGVPRTGWGSEGTAAVTVESLNRYLESKASPMAGSGRDLLIAGARYDIDPRLIVAIAG
jgi:hypothetical protein